MGHTNGAQEDTHGGTLGTPVLRLQRLRSLAVRDSLGLIHLNCAPSTEELSPEYLSGMETDPQNSDSP